MVDLDAIEKLLIGKFGFRWAHEMVRELRTLRARVAEMEREAALGKTMLTPRERESWDEEHRCVLWWKLPVDQPPYVGSPLDEDFPEYVTHWTPLICPDEAGHLRAEEGGE